MPTTTSTILFTDAVESTSLRTELGETAADELFRDHERRLQGIVTDHRGTVVKTAGDGIMAAFDCIDRRGVGGDRRAAVRRRSAFLRCRCRVGSGRR